MQKNDTLIPAICPEEYAKESISIFIEYFGLFSTYLDVCLEVINNGFRYVAEDMVNRLILLKVFLKDMIYPILNDGIIQLQPTLPTGETTAESRIRIMESIINLDILICKYNIDEEKRKECVEEYQQFVEKIHTLDSKIQIQPINKGKVSFMNKMKGILKKNREGK